MTKGNVSQSLRICAIALTAWVGAASTASARVLDFSKYGVTPNATCPASPGGICGASAAINSFTYLQNMFPDLYQNRITPNLMPDGTDPEDALDFANYYYDLGGATNEWLNSYMNAKKWWIDGKAPGTTFYSSMYAGSNYNDGKPSADFLTRQIGQGEDVELFVSIFDQDSKFLGNHAITLYGIEDIAGVIKLYYQDPNDPTNDGYTPLTTVTDGYLSFGGLFGFAGSTSVVYAAFAESPVPEVGTWLMMVAGFGLAGGALRRRTVTLAFRF